jgi:hypothetical protein
LLGASFKNGGSIDFSGSRAIIPKTFTDALFSVTLSPLSNHLGHLLFVRFGFGNPFITGVPDGFSSFFYILVQYSGNT